MLPPPGPPFDRWPVQIADEAASFYLWYVPPGVFAVQLHGSSVTLLTTQRLVRLMDEAREERAEEIRAAGGMLVFHDWSRPDGIDRAASRFLQAAWKKLRREDVRAVYVAAKLNPIATVVLHTINGIAAAMTGKTNVLVRDIGEPLAKHHVPAPTAGSTFPSKVRSSAR